MAKEITGRIRGFSKAGDSWMIEFQATNEAPVRYYWRGTGCKDAFLKEVSEGNIKNIPATIRVLGPLIAPASGPLKDLQEIELLKIKGKC